MVACLVAFTAADKSFQAIMGCGQNKLRNPACLIGLFVIDINTEFLKLRLICSHSRSEDHFYISKSLVYFGAPHFRLVPSHFVYLVAVLMQKHPLHFILSRDFKNLL